MSKDRRFTRAELESLRRADLQNLYKINGLKGANQSTEILRDTLVSHFESPAFISPGRRGNPQNGNGVNRLAGKIRGFGEKKAGTVGTIPTGAKGVVRGDMKKRAVVVKKAMEPVKATRPVMPVAVEAEQPEAGPSRPTSPQEPLPANYEVTSQLKLLDSRLARLEVGSSNVTEHRLRQMLDERDREWEARLSGLEEAYQRRVRELEVQLEERIRALQGQTQTLGRKFVDTPEPSDVSAPGSTHKSNAAVPQFLLTEDTPTNVSLGKRTERNSSPIQTPGAGPSQSPAAKRPRVDERERGHETEPEEESDILSPHTPSPPTASIVPRTPSPGHQGHLPDQSRTPGIGSDFFANAPPGFGSSKREADESHLPYPLFTTTPRPVEPTSPTLDAPSSASRRRIGIPRASTLTPGRKRLSPAPRAVSDAHKELHTITESEEPGLGGAGSVSSIARRRVASADTHVPPLLGSALRGSSVPISPPQLSPSPSIGASEQEGGFTYTPFPPVPRSRLSKAYQASPTPKRPRSRPTNNASPSRDYMDVAMFGLPQGGAQGGGAGAGAGGSDGGSPSMMMATPGHRTMLGTERYRDTRFGDVPVVSWGSPSVDLGPGTPALGSGGRGW